jgi:hypothetical protein
MVRHGELDQLLRPRIESVALVSKPPPDHRRGAAPVLATLIGMLLGTFAGFELFGSALGGVGGMLLGMVGYRKHVWKTVVIRRPRLAAVPAPVKPSMTAIVGTVHAYTGTIGTLEPAITAVATAVVLRSAIDRDGVVLRAARAVPFWLVAGSRRVLVTGSCWVGFPGQPREIGRALVDLEIPMSLIPKRPFVEEAWISPGDRVAVTGRVRDQQVPGLGYRESTVETIEGEPGAVAWIERA